MEITTLNTEELIKDIVNRERTTFINRKYNLSYEEIKQYQILYKAKYKDRKDEFLNLYNTKLSLPEIKDKMNIDNRLVYDFYKVWIGDDKNNSANIRKFKKKERNDNVIEMIKKGVKVSIIANKFGLSEQRIGQIARNNGFYLEQVKEENYASYINKIENAIKDGLSYSELCDDFNLTNYVITKLRKHGLSDIRKYYVDKRKNDFIKLYDEGKTAEEILKSDANMNAGSLKLTTIDNIYNIVCKSVKKRTNVDEVFRLRIEVKLIIKTLLNAGKTYDFIVNYLNEKGYKTSYEKPYTLSNIQYVIQRVRKEF